MAASTAPSRDQAATAVRRRLELAADGNPTAVTEAAALADAVALAVWAEPGHLDIEVVHLLAAIHWLRYQLLPEGEDATDAESAIAWFARLLPWRPEAVPPPLLPILAEHAPPAGDEIADWYDEAQRLLDDPAAAGHLAIIDRAVRLLQRCVSAAGSSDPGRPVLLADVGSALLTRFGLSRELADVTAAVETMRAALDLLPPDDPDRPRMLSNLGAALRARFERTGLAVDGAAAIGSLQAAVGLTQPDDPSLATRLSNLANAFASRFARFGDPADIDAAVDAGRRAQALVSPGHPDYARILANLANALQRRFELTGDVADIVAAVDAARTAAEATPFGHKDRPGRQASLSNALLSRFLRTGNRDDLDDAITVGQEAAGFTDHPNVGMYLSNLGNAYQVRFDWNGDLADSEMAVDLLRRAVAATPPDHSERPLRLSNLGTAQFARAARTGDPTDLDAAISSLREALGTIPDDHPGRTGIMSNLANALWKRFANSGESADLAEAIGLLRAVVEATPPGHGDYPTYVSNLGNALLDRFNRLGDIADIDGAIDAGAEAVRRTPTDHASRPMFLSNLSNALRARFERTANPADLAAAIEASREAVALTPPAHADRAGRIANLANALWTRFEHSGDLADIEATVDLAETAVELTPNDHPARAGRLANLANALWARFDRNADPRDQARAARCFAEGLALDTAMPVWRVRCGVGLARLEVDRGDWQAAESAWEAVLALLPLVVDRGLSRADRQHHLRVFSTVATGAAAAALALGAPDRAWRMLEQGRGVLLGQVLDTTAPPELRRQHPDLATEMSRIRSVLNAEGVAPELRRQARRDWDRLVETLRTKPGFERFGQPPTMDDLRSAARDGTVIAINVTAWRCDALFLSADGIDHCPLPDLTGADAVAWANKLLLAVRQPDWTTNSVLRDVLAWLWDTAIGPALTHVGYVAAPTGDWPRVWWLPTGPLAVLPVHAAGRHGRSSEGTALDRVISSYVPTVRVLARARAAHAATQPMDALVLGIDGAAGAPELQHAEEEAALVHNLLGPGSHMLLGPGATVDAVRTGLAKARWAHFSCHAQTAPDPAESALVLYDGRLPVRDIAQLDRPDAVLAFLSACTTSYGGSALLDESIHVASAFQTAGFAHVVGTLWTQSDYYGIEFAKRIYEQIMAGAEPASAVHQAVRAARDRYPDNPYLWAPHIHFGA